MVETASRGPRVTGRDRDVAAIERALKRLAKLIRETKGIEVVIGEGAAYVFRREAYNAEIRQHPNLHFAPGYHRDDAEAVVELGAWCALVQQ